MEILKRTKGLLRFRTTEGTVVLKDGKNLLSQEEFKLIEEHPMFKAMVVSEGLVVSEDKAVQNKDVKVAKTESNGQIDISSIDLEAQGKKTLVKIANSLDIETQGLDNKELIEKIKASK